MNGEILKHFYLIFEFVSAQLLLSSLVKSIFFFEFKGEKEEFGVSSELIRDKKLKTIFIMEKIRKVFNFSVMFHFF